jgi:hypothetical protein
MAIDVSVVTSRDSEAYRNVCTFERPQSELVGRLNARQVDWTVLLYGKDCDRTFVLGHAGAVCAAPITTSNYPPTRRGAATFLPPH